MLSSARFNIRNAELRRLLKRIYCRCFLLSLFFSSVDNKIANIWGIPPGEMKTFAQIPPVARFQIARDFAVNFYSFFKHITSRHLLPFKECAQRLRYQFNVDQKLRLFYSHFLRRCWSREKLEIKFNKFFSTSSDADLNFRLLINAFLHVSFVRHFMFSLKIIIELTSV